MADDTLCVNTIRTLCADIVQKANSGHPGAPLGMAPMAHLLWTKFLRYNPKNPHWVNRDRFVLSNGHACALQYAMLHLTGYHFTMDDLKQFRQLGSKTPGHPECGPEHESDGIELCTGPLGQGLSTSVGMAIAEAMAAERFNKEGFPLFDHRTWVFCGDGCLQEGITSEASSLAGHLGLSKLIVLYDDNDITIDGGTDLSFTEDVGKRYEAYGWNVLTVTDMNDLPQLAAAMEAAKAETSRPTLIKVKSVIGYGSAKQGTHSVHGAPLGDEDIKALKTKFGLDPELTFNVSDDVYKRYNNEEAGKELEAKWNALFEEYKKQFPELGAELTRRLAGKLPDDWKSALPTFSPSDAPNATRNLGGAILNKLAGVLPEIVGGSADLNPSTKTYINDGTGDFQKATHGGRNLRFGIREHAMCAIVNGLAAYQRPGFYLPYGATFFTFIGYAYGAVILASLSKFRAWFIMTHDSIGLGEDGPTHQPIEKTLLCRSTPNMLFLRPADGNETSGAYAVAVEATETPAVVALTRQNLPHLAGTSIDGVAKGGYVISGGDKPSLILIGTGSELHLCTQAAEKLENVRVVSMPCWELFDKQPEEYRKSILPAGVPVLSVEAGVTAGWAKYSHAQIGIDTFGASGTGDSLFKHFGFSVENVVEKANKLKDYYKERPVPDLVDRPF